MTDLKEVFKQAAEIAQQVPENMQEAAFNRALDLLTNRSGERNTTRRVKRARHYQNRNLDRQPTKGSSAESAIPRKASKKSRKSSSGLSPKPAIVGLIESGFFGVGKTLPAVRDHLRKKRGYDLSLAQLGVAMLRMVRDGLLEREENQDGQYEYKQPKSHPSKL
jgi:hypothetical protein